MNGTPAQSGFIEFEHVSKGFDGHSVLHDVSFSVATGQTLCVMGRSGVGKSVTLKLIMGFLRPDSGRIFVDGVEMDLLNTAQLTEMHKKITMVFQSGALFDSLTVFENVAFPLRERDDENEDEIETVVDGLLDMLDLKPYRDRFPDELSTGMKRAVAIARALAAKPRAILYDEPTTMVDPLMSETIGNLIGKVKREVKLTSMVITHDTRLARKLADRLVMLDQGQVRFDGTVAELDASTDPVVREFMQMDELQFT